MKDSIANFQIQSFARVEFHPYRTATPIMSLMTLERESEAGKELEELLYKKARAQAGNSSDIRKDNHVCFSLSSCFNSAQPDETKLVVMISDFNISIGMGLVQERW